MYGPPIGLFWDDPRTNTDSLLFLTFGQERSCVIEQKPFMWVENPFLEKEQVFVENNENQKTRQQNKTEK